MKILLDEHLSHRLRPLLIGHDVFTVQYMGWRGVQNGDLLTRAAAAGFDALLTMDFGIRYQQNLSSLPCSIVVLHAPSNAMEHLEPLVPRILAALASLAPRTVVHVH
jgi:hypothetical protein